MHAGYATLDNYRWLCSQCFEDFKERFAWKVMTRKARDPEVLMHKMNSSALEVAKEFGIELDYSDESMKHVEKMLGQIHEEYQETGDEEGLRGLALFFAAYIGEVIRKKGFGGTWERDHPAMGKETFPFHWSGGTLFLYSWCLKRIVDGKQDDMWVKYQSLVLDRLRQHAEHFTAHDRVLRGEKQCYDQGRAPHTLVLLPWAACEFGRSAAEERHTFT